jgi:hypothetical protein
MFKTCILDGTAEGEKPRKVDAGLNNIGIYSPKIL